MTKQSRLRALQNQVRRLSKRLEHLEGISERLSWIRVAVFLGGVFLSLVAYYAVDLWLFWVVLLVAIIAFIALVYPHRRINRQLKHVTIWLSIKKAHIARMTLDWAQMPPATIKARRATHPFEADIDLVGERSLHRLLDTCVSREGSERLREWLATPIPDLAQLQARQRLVAELINLSNFRSRLILAARQVAGDEGLWEASRLQKWFEHQRNTQWLVWLILIQSGFALGNMILFALYWFEFLPALWLFTLIPYVVIFLLWAQSYGDFFHEALDLQEALKQLGAVSELLEKHNYRQTPHLKELCAPFLNSTSRPSNYIRRMNRLMTALGLRQNPYIGLGLNLIMPWDFYCAYWLEQYKQELAPKLTLWLDKWIELEALSSLANFAYLNPTYSLPTVLASVTTPSDQPFVFQATALGHPLIPAHEKVCNDFTINNLGDVAILTGSNMAGKSSFLRTMALNLALTYAGAPVNAQTLVTIPFRLFTCIKVTDSVTDGISYFYAEVKRLKALLLALESNEAYPLLFLIDEIFRGTNNRERLIGSRAYIRNLVGKEGTGLISTHDLELVNLADEITQIKNYHFREEVIDQQMIFDYTLRLGPCPTTNALKIMQLEGLLGGGIAPATAFDGS